MFKNISFYFRFKRVRALRDNNNIWFVVGDISRALGIKDCTEFVRTLPQSEHGIYTINGICRYEEHSIISATSVYKVAHLAEQEKANQFLKWLSKKT